MRIRLLIIAMYHENDQDPHEQGLQEHPELPQQVGLREQVLPSTQGPPLTNRILSKSRYLNTQHAFARLAAGRVLSALALAPRHVVVRRCF